MSYFERGVGNILLRYNLTSIQCVYTFRCFFKVHTPTGCGPSVSGASVCMSVSDPFLIGCEKSRDKILGF